MRRFALRWLICFALVSPFIIVLLVVTLVYKPDITTKDCNALLFQITAYFLRIVLFTSGFLCIFAYFDSVCLKAKLYDQAPMVEGIGDT